MNSTNMSNDSLKNPSVGIIALIGGLLVTLLAYLFGTPSLYYFSFSIILICVAILYVDLFYELYSHFNSRQTAVIIVFFFLSIYFSLRLNLLDFSLIVGDASDYLWSGVGSVTQNRDLGFFLPLSAAIAGMGYQIVGLEHAPFMTTYIYASMIPLLYFFLKQTKISIYLIIPLVFLFEAMPLPIWFSKTTFSEPVWQVLLLLLLLTSYKILQTEKPTWHDFASLAALICLAIFSRGTSIFLFGLLTFVCLYHFWLHNNIRTIVTLLTVLLLFDIAFFYALNIRSDYLIGWQFSRIISSITPVKLIALMLSASFLVYIALYILHKNLKSYENINIPLVTTLSLIILKAASAFYFSYRNQQYGFFKKLLGMELNFAVGNFGYFLSVIIIIGITYLYYSAAKGNRLHLLVLVFYTLFFIPFSMADISYNKPHELLLYWNRYYFSEIFIVHLFSLLIGLNLLYKTIQPYVISNKYMHSFFLFSVIALTLLTFNSKMFSLVTGNGYLSNSSSFFEWVENKSKNNEVIILFDSSIKYGPYNSQQLTNAAFSRLGTNVINYKKVTFTDLNMNEIIKEHENDNLLLLSISNKQHIIENKKLIFVDKFHTSLSWLRHLQKPENVIPTYMDIEAYLYKIHPSFNVNKKYLINKSSFIIPKLLGDGWYSIEDNHVWSKHEAKLHIPVSSDCKKEDCVLKLDFSAFNANSISPKVVLFYAGKHQLAKVKIEGKETVSQIIRIPSKVVNFDTLTLTVKISNVTSPKEIGLSSDNRKLGIALTSLSLEVKEVK